MQRSDLDLIASVNWCEHCGVQRCRPAQAVVAAPSNSAFVAALGSHLAFSAPTAFRIACGARCGRLRPETWEPPSSVESICRRTTIPLLVILESSCDL